MSNFFCLTRPKKIIEESFRVSFSLDYRKSLCIRGVYNDTLPKFFCRTVPKKIVEESFSVSFNFGYRKTLRIRGVGHDFLSVFFVSHYQ